MKCPYCHVNYDDSERVCPVCGKRAGVTASAKNAASGWEKRLSAQKKPGTYNKQQKTSSAKRTATDTPRSDHPYADGEKSRTYQASPSGWKKQSSGSSAPKIILGIVAALFLLQLVLPLLFGFVDFSSLGSRIEQEVATFIDEEFINDGVNFEYQENIPKSLIGTWECKDAKISFTLNEDGSFRYSDQDMTQETSGTDLYQITWTEETTTEDLEHYLYGNLPELELEAFDLYALDVDFFKNYYIDSMDIAVPRDEPAVTSILCVDPVTGALLTFEKQTERA